MVKKAASKREKTQVFFTQLFSFLKDIKSSAKVGRGGRALLGNTPCTDGTIGTVTHM